MAPVRADLLEWRMASGNPPDDAPIFPRPDGAQWRETDYRNWRCRVFKPLAKRVGLGDGFVPYDLRHSAASLWAHEGRSVVEVAAWLGHSPDVCLRTYQHVFEDVHGAVPRDAEQAIREARVPPVFPDRRAAADA